jgi:hypothetical protein
MGMEHWYRIDSLKITERFMRSTKASKGGEKIVVSFEIRRGNGSFQNFNIVFHHDRVFIKTICNQKFRGGVFYYGLHKTNFPFNMMRFGFDYNYEQIPTIELVNLAFKMFTNYTIGRQTINGPIYLIEHS